MKSWRPETPPSNRDRLELYALHKQAVSGDAPTVGSTTKSLSIPEKAKLNAWKAKRGTIQAEAMNAYVTECDRQTRVYGTASVIPAETSPPPPGTPTNTPGDTTTNNNNNNNSASGSNNNNTNNNPHVLLVPRGLTAVPLLCAAAAESRVAYLHRLSQTSSSQGWWYKQEPLCADPGTWWAVPEAGVLWCAARAERLALSSNLPNIPANVVRSFLWPLHNALLAVWILLIFLSTLLGSVVIFTRTGLWGSNTTGVPLRAVWREEILPAATTATGLCGTHQALSVRLGGLALVPFVTICDVSYYGVNSGAASLWPGAMLYVWALVMTWWYWLCVLPWMTVVGVTISISAGWCFALIELATIIQL